MISTHLAIADHWLEADRTAMHESIPATPGSPSFGSGFDFDHEPQSSGQSNFLGGHLESKLCYPGKLCYLCLGVYGLITKVITSSVITVAHAFLLTEKCCKLASQVW